ncbi:hypothetical protein [Methylobacterium sp. Leaf456]|uniref:hypothetical protein n=1 Tax=Methylobacterium sp. Leaf456 TaxID=1736382 RepID=UPI000A69E8E8|nr:hypothetical protein [Methylobacterium sp. Leaf456]
MAQAAPRKAPVKASRIRALWPSRDLRPPPPEPVRVPAAPADESLPLRGLTAHELIAMARAARARSLEAEGADSAAG